MSTLLAFLQSHEEAFRSRTRLASLYSDFRYQRQTNPDGFQANVTAWLNALSSAAQQGLLPCSAASKDDRLVLSACPELLESLQTQEHGRPLALGAVLAEAAREKQLVPLKDFRDSTKSIYAKSWLPSPWQAVSWGLKSLGIMGEDRAFSKDDKLPKGEFVIVANLEAAANAILEQASKSATSHTSRVFTRELFAETFSSAVGVDRLSTKDVSILITYLVRDRDAISYSSASGTIKFKSPGDIHPDEITEEDASIASIRSLIATLEPQIEELTSRISNLNLRARDAVNKKQTTIAKTALRSKKISETRLLERTTTLNQLEDLYAKIEQAADQVELVRVMESAGKTLKSLNAQTGGVDRVQDLVDGLREQMMDVDDISQAINGATNVEIDEDEVEDELEELERAVSEKKRVEESQSKADQNDDRQAESTRRALEQLEDLHIDDTAASEIRIPASENA